MVLRSLVLAAGWVVLAGMNIPATAQTKTKGKNAALPVNGMVIEFARRNLGEKVGDGECWALANAALLVAGAKSSPSFKDSPNPGDYVWGELVYGLEIVDGKPVETGNKKLSTQPGDIVQFRDTQFEGARAGGGTYSMTAGHHTAIVLQPSPREKLLKVLHQNWQDKRIIMEATFKLGDLRSGWIKVYRPSK